MQTTNSKSESKHKRRHGRLADELARAADCSRYTAQQSLKLERLIAAIATRNPEIADQTWALGNFVRDGVLKYRDAIPLLEALKLAPELIPLVASGKLPLAECLQTIRQASKEADDELSFEEKVEQGFERFLSKWPKDKDTRRRIWSVIEDTFDAFYE